MFYLLLCVVLPVLLYKLWMFGSRERHMPPGPPTAPIIGNAHQFPPNFPQLRFAVWAKEYGDVFTIKLLNSSMIIISSPRAVRDLLDKRGAITGGRPRSHMQRAHSGLHMVLEDMETSVWRRGRKAIHRFLTPEQIEAYMPTQQIEYTQFLYDVLNSPDELFKHTKRTSASVMTSLVYGKRCPTYENSEIEKYFLGIKLFNETNDPGAYPPIELLPWLQYIPRWLAPWTAHCDLTMHTRNSLYYGLLEELENNIKAGKKTGSYLESVLENQANLDMTRDEVAYLGGVLMDAGGETSASYLQSFLLAILTYPECQRKAQEEIDRVVGPDRMPTLEDYEELPYLKALLNEVHRFRPILPIGIPRINTEDIQYNGFYIPKGCMLVMNVWGIFHDPDLYHHPERFEPERYLRSQYGTKPGADVSAFRDNFAFGSGRRICPGEGMGQKTGALNAMNLLWAFSFAPKDDTFTGMNMESYAVPGLEMAPNPFSCKIVPRDDRKAAMIRKAYADVVPQ